MVGRAVTAGAMVASIAWSSSDMVTGGELATGGPTLLAELPPTWTVPAWGTVACSMFAGTVSVYEVTTLSADNLSKSWVRHSATPEINPPRPSKRTALSTNPGVASVTVGERLHSITRADLSAHFVSLAALVCIDLHLLFLNRRR